MSLEMNRANFSNKLLLFPELWQKKKEILRSLLWYYFPDDDSWIQREKIRKFVYAVHFRMKVIFHKDDRCFVATFLHRNTIFFFCIFCPYVIFSVCSHLPCCHALKTICCLFTLHEMLNLLCRVFIHKQTKMWTHMTY